MSKASSPPVFSIPFRISNPRLNIKTGKLEPSIAEFKKPPHSLVMSVLRLLSSLHLIRLYTASELPQSQIAKSKSLSKELSDGTLVDDNPDEIVACSNMTVINLALVLLGPMREDHLCMTLLLLQVICGGLGLFIRHRLAFLIYDQDS